MGETQLHQSLFFRIERGIAQFNNDYYAVLGVPIDASPAFVRQNYLRIARRLHPDVYGLSASETEVATQFLAKLVNPAYNALMRPQEREAYQAIFKLLVRRLMMKERQVEIFAELAQKLLQSPSNWLYQQYLAEISACQYSNIEHILECTAQLSELNLVYIFHKYAEESVTKKRDSSSFSGINSAANQSIVLVCANQTIKLPKILPSSADKASKSSMSSSGSKSFTVGDGVTMQPLPKPALPKLDYVALPPLNLVKPDPIDESTILRNRREMVSLHQRFATSYMNQGQWLLALRELRSLVQLDPKNVPALSLMGVAHRQLSQWRLAKEAFEQAKLIAPDDEFINQQLEILRNMINNTAGVTGFGGDTTILQTNQTSQTGQPPQGTRTPSAGNKGNNKGSNTSHDAKLPAKNPAPPPEGWWHNFWKNFNGK